MRWGVNTNTIIIPLDEIFHVGYRICRISFACQRFELNRGCLENGVDRILYYIRYV